MRGESVRGKFGQGIGLIILPRKGIYTLLPTDSSLVCMTKKFIKINTVIHMLTENTISYEDVVRLRYGDTANPDTTYSVSFSNGNQSGIMMKGSSIRLYDGMTFHVYYTGNG